MTDRTAEVALHGDGGASCAALWQPRGDRGNGVGVRGLRIDRGSYDMSIRDGLREPGCADMCISERRVSSGQIIEKPWTDGETTATSLASTRTAAASA